MRRFFGFLFVVLCAPALGAGGTIYRCTGPTGEPLFSQTDCGVGAVSIESMPVQAIGEGLRSAERAALRARRVSPTQGRTASGGAVKAAVDTARKQQYRCTRTRQQLESVEAERRRGYPAGKGRVLRERQAKYEAYLASFCS